MKDTAAIAAARRAFERWMTDHGFGGHDFEYAGGGYASTFTQATWLGFLAGQRYEKLRSKKR